MNEEIDHSNLDPSIQIVVLAVALLHLLVWYFQLFVDPGHNMLALIFGIVILFWLATITVRFALKSSDCMQKKDWYQIELPSDFKCFIGDKNCENGNINLWSVFHFIIYFIAGLYVPAYYVEILIISISCELFESAIGHTSKMIADPVINMAGYVLGSSLSRNKFKY
jgi:hypothetical protein